MEMWREGARSVQTRTTHRRGFVAPRGLPSDAACAARTVGRSMVRVPGARVVIVPTVAVWAPLAVGTVVPLETRISLIVLLTRRIVVAAGRVPAVRVPVLQAPLAAIPPPQRLVS